MKHGNALSKDFALPDAKRGYSNFNIDIDLGF